MIDGDNVELGGQCLVREGTIIHRGEDRETDRFVQVFFLCDFSLLYFFFFLFHGFLLLLSKYLLLSNSLSFYLFPLLSNFFSSQIFLLSKNILNILDSLFILILSL